MSPVGGPPRRVKKPKNDDKQAPTVFETLRVTAGAILANPPVPTTHDILTTETKTKKRRVDPPRPATDIHVSDVLEKEKEAFEKQIYRRDQLEGQFQELKDELAALNEECSKEFDAHPVKCDIARENNRHPIYGIPAPLKKNIHGDA